MDSFYPFLDGFWFSYDSYREKKKEQIQRLTDYNSLRMRLYNRHGNEVNEECIDFLGLPLTIRQNILEKLPYDDLAVMECSSLAVRNQINHTEILGDMEMYAFCSSEGDLKTVTSKDAKPKFDLLELLETTNVRIKVKELIIEGNLLNEYIDKMYSLIQTNGTPIESITYGATFYFGFIAVQRLPSVCDLPRFFEFLIQVGAKNFVCHWKMRESDLYRTEIKKLEKIELWGGVVGTLTQETLLQMTNPVIKIQFEDLKSDAVIPFLEQWLDGSRNIKCLLLSGFFDKGDILAAIPALPIWTKEEVDSHVLEAFHIPTVPMKKLRPEIMLLKRGEEKNDHLVLIFGRLFFAAATLDGIIEEDLLKELKLIP